MQDKAPSLTLAVTMTNDAGSEQNQSLRRIDRRVVADAVDQWRRWRFR
jgi:hypothetical protein